MTLKFLAFGVPQPKGSAKAFIPKGWKRAIVTSDNPKNKGWQQIVAEAATTALAEAGGQMVEGPVSLVVDFFLPKPKSAPRKAIPHLKKPDLDKLVRSVKDALTKVAWADDSQVVRITASKTYAPVGHAPGVRVEVFDLDADHAAFAAYPSTSGLLSPSEWGDRDADF